jgi:glycosyltransferase involved in cell wall biosynthesis
MRIAFLSFFSGINYRGAETYVYELAARLSEAGNEVTVYQNGKTRNAAYQTRFLSSPGSLPAFDPIPDILIPVNGRLQAIAARVWTMIHHKKIVISGQSGPGFDDRLNLYTFPDTFVALTAYQSAWAGKTNPRVKVVTIPNGVDLERFSPRVKPLKISLPRPVVLYVAALEPIKRCDLLIRAVAQTKASLLIAGKGNLAASLNALGNQLLPGRFQIASFPYDRMPSVYTACDLYAYSTSPWEAFGISVIEAMASGLPVIATDDPIRREIVGPAGLFADPRDPPAFTGAITKALESDWENKPRLRSAEFSWDKIADSYSELFRRLESGK